jgi:glycosyltransferase involved in cell wall biosynthesis
MKVLHIEGGTHVYGGPYQVIHLLRALGSRGTHFLVCPQKSDVAAEAARQGLDVLPIPFRGDAGVGTYFSLRRLIEEKKPDLVHVHSRRGADLWGVLAAWRARVPLVITRRVDNPEARWLAGLRYRPATKVVGISEKICRVLASEGVPEEKLVCIRDGVDTVTFTPSADRTILQREFGIAPDEKTVLMAAQFIRRKGHAVLLKAVPEILASCPRTRFLLAGRGPLHDEIREAAAVYGDRVILPGFRGDMARITPACDLLVHPAEMEGLGVVILQAGACGIPVVASKAGGIPEVVRDGESGLLFDPGDVHALARLTISLLSDDSRAAAMGRFARNLVAGELSIGAMADANYRLYEEILR